MICILGAGIVGCSTAYHLVREGHQVLLIDAAPGPGQGCSFANGSQLSYAYVEPLATPAVLRSLPKLLLERDSPVRFGPTLDWRQYAWGLQFLAACRTDQVRRATRQLLELSFLSRDTLAAWLSDDASGGEWPVAYRRNGKLVLCPDEETLARQKRQMEFQATLGCEQQALSIDQCLEKEPALLPAVRRAPRAYAGGIWTPGDSVADAHALCEALVARVRARGGQARFGMRVTGFVTGRGGVTALRTREGEIACDALVVATGSDSAQVGQQLGEYLPVYPIRGYSLTLPMRGAGADANHTANGAAEAVRPSISVTDLGRKTVFAPLGDSLRVAAVAEIAGHGRTLAPDRFEQMRASVEAVYPGSVDVQAEGRPWAGLRPATPTSLPIIRRSSRHANVYFNVGQGALGLTLAAGSAVRLQRCLDEGRGAR
jgi:D-amino-acid dehydrogenase